MDDVPPSTTPSLLSPSSSEVSRPSTTAVILLATVTNTSLAPLLLSSQSQPQSPSSPESTASLLSSLLLLYIYLYFLHQPNSPTRRPRSSQRQEITFNICNIRLSNDHNSNSSTSTIEINYQILKIVINETSTG